MTNEERIDLFKKKYRELCEKYDLSFDAEGEQATAWLVLTLNKGRDHNIGFKYGDELSEYQLRQEWVKNDIR